ncbi:hypothetical protein [Haemophilus haemolyticus]|mgnify:FL=1|jgi:hypothetical protein|uniref:Uncharacterized protein n=1 Tax=Haemophilus haemolyticus TaxID=726 RepID=A0ABY2YMF8_HAEHA|nr:hypothetical protein [Haemophilus haemolyticus]TPH03453.1 hypothetical protein EUX50_06840 [Haemophilus haemolyticus]
MTLFDECEEALSEDFHLLSEDEKEQVLKEFYKYPFEYGSIDKDSKKIKILNPDRLIELIEKKIINQNVYVLADINDVPIFKTNLLLALDKLDDISALSTRVFILGIGYLAQIVSRNPPLDIVIPINGDISKFL